MLTKEGSTKIVNFMTPRGRNSCARVWPYKSYSENALFLKKSSSVLPGMDETNAVYSDDDKGRVYPNYNFMTPGSCRTAALRKVFVGRPERHSAIHINDCIFFAQKKLRTYAQNSLSEH